jgi:hypothetical protein
MRDCVGPRLLRLLRLLRLFLALAFQFVLFCGFPWLLTHRKVHSAARQPALVPSPVSRACGQTAGRIMKAQSLQSRPEDRPLPYQQC